MKNVLAVVALLATCSFTEATGCRTVVRVQSYDYAYAVVQPVYQTVYQPIAVPVYVPAYSVGYSATTDQTALQIENLRLKNEILEGRVQQLQQFQQQRQQQPQVLTQPPQPVIEQPAPPPNGGEQLKKKEPQQGKEHPGLSYLQKSCVACHDASVAKAKGGGQAFFDGGKLLTTLTAEQRLAAIGAIYQGRMPKGGAKQATDEEVAAVINFFDPGAAAASK